MGVLRAVIEKVFKPDIVEAQGVGAIQSVSQPATPPVVKPKTVDRYESAAARPQPSPRGEDVYDLNTVSVSSMGKTITITME